VWTNFDVICGQLDISKAIDKQFLLDFLKKELSQNVTRDKTTQLVKIKQTTRLALETALEKFIDRSILCQKCDLPELNDKRICRSCGSLQK
jgi:translation initiation factor 2 beta subunit (eIF-2beta)/eIF-5